MNKFPITNPSYIWMLCWFVGAFFSLTAMSYERQNVATKILFYVGMSPCFFGVLYVLWVVFQIIVIMNWHDWSGGVTDLNNYGYYD